MSIILSLKFLKIFCWYFICKHLYIYSTILLTRVQMKCDCTVSFNPLHRFIRYVIIAIIFISSSSSHGVLLIGMSDVSQINPAPWSFLFPFTMPSRIVCNIPVSYTHLDVYKRQKSAIACTVLIWLPRRALAIPVS